MANGFTPLADLVRQPSIAPVVSTPPQPVVPEGPRSTQTVAPVEHVELCTRIALARLAATEAFQRASRRVLEEFAKSVLGRELLLANTDIAAIARNALETLAAEEPVALIVAPEDVHHIACGVAVRPDETLRSGDLIVEVRDGVVDARLEVRMRAAIDQAAS